jgi:hypothetical protein
MSTKEQSKGNGKRRWNAPNWNAQARLLAGGDLRSAFLLIRIMQAWNGTKRKLRRCGREWVAMPLEDWWRSAGLSESECNNYAIPLLKANCAEFLRFESWKLRHDGPKSLFVSIDEAAMNERFQFLDQVSLATEWKDYHEPLKGIGYEYEMDEDGKPMINGKPAKLGYYCLAKLTASDLNRKRKTKPPQGQPWKMKPQEDTTS